MVKRRSGDVTGTSNEDAEVACWGKLFQKLVADSQVRAMISDEDEAERS